MSAGLAGYRRRRDIEDERGFTLIELLIVIVILGILAGIVVFAVQNLTGSSAQSACRTDYKSVESGLETYKAQMGAYPTGGGTQNASGTAVSSSTNTDTDSATAPAFKTQAQLGTPAGPTGSNVAAAAGGAAGGELLAGSNTVASATQKDASGTATFNLDAPSGTPASTTGAVGPWLRDVPQNTGHYTIWAANDGSGSIGVLNSKGIALPGTSATYVNDITACNAVS